MKIEILIGCFILCIASGYTQIATINESEIVVESDGWKLIGDLTTPRTDDVFPAVLMLNKANDDRHVYKDLAMQLAKRGIASLRLDLRGHGSSINLGKYIPGKNRPDPLIYHRDRLVMNQLMALILAVFRGYMLLPEMNVI